MRQAMQTDIRECCEILEECYEFSLSYAAQGHSADESSEAARQLREHLSRAAAALAGLEESSAAAIEAGQLGPAAPCQAFFAVLVRDAASSIAAIELVLAQPAISSQLIDNLNASIHIRALLTDLFLVTEILEARETQAKAMASKSLDSPASETHLV
jgi:hypothetical protein